jgi:hypothetical protein
MDARSSTGGPSEVWEAEPVRSPAPVEELSEEERVRKLLQLVGEKHGREGGESRKGEIPCLAVAGVHHHHHVVPPTTPAATRLHA